jgi:hypothetical protein
VGRDLTGAGRARWVTRWKPALNAFAITFGDRFPSSSASPTGSPRRSAGTVPRWAVIDNARPFCGAHLDPAWSSTER